MKNYLSILSLIVFFSLSNFLLASQQELIEEISAETYFNRALAYVEKSGFRYISDLEKFEQKYAIPTEYADKIRKKERRILGQVYEEPISGVPFFKKNTRENLLKRIINAERIRECIRQNNLFLLDVPHKYIYTASTSKQLVFAESIDYYDFGLEDYSEYHHIDYDSINKKETIKKYLNLSLEEVKQLMILIKVTGYDDWHYGNLVRNRVNNKLYIIDTEDGSFINISHGETLFDQCFQSFSDCFYCDMQDDVFEYFDDEFNNLYTQNIPSCSLSSYDATLNQYNPCKDSPSEYIDFTNAEVECFVKNKLNKDEDGNDVLPFSVFENWALRL